MLKIVSSGDFAPLRALRFLWQSPVPFKLPCPKLSSHAEKSAVALHNNEFAEGAEPAPAS
jgi:hypothetical protein